MIVCYANIRVQNNQMYFHEVFAVILYICLQSVVVSCVKLYSHETSKYIIMKYHSENIWVS